MKLVANIEPLKGKYYGTKVSVYYADEKYQDNFEINVWCYYPEVSEREEKGTEAVDHFESSVSYKIAKVIEEALNEASI